MPPITGRKVTRIIEAVQANIWAILPEKLEEITGFLHRAESGDMPTEDEISATIASAYGRDNHKSLRDLTAWDDDEEADAGQPLTVNGVRILTIYGTITNRADIFMRYSGGTSTIEFERQLAAAVNDSKVKSIMIDIDSPGGSAIGTAELATAIYNARGKKPIVAMVRGLMASAAYWIGTSADKVYATESSMIGSIGVLTVHVDRSEANKKFGVNYTVFQAGEHKTDGHPYGPLTDKSRASIQERIDAIYSEFVQAVARNRDVTKTRVEQDFGQGKVFLANQAANVGMIDAVSTFETVLRELQGTQATSPSSTRNTMNPKIKATLFACGLVASQEASDEVFQCALSTFYMFAGRDQPSIETDADKIISDLIAFKAQGSAGLAGNLASAGANNNANANAGGQQNGNQAANGSAANNGNTVDVDQAIANAFAEDQKRRDELTAIGEQLGIDSETVQAACNDRTFTPAKAQADWKKLVELSGTPFGSIKPGQAGLDRIADGAVQGIMFRLGLVQQKDLNETGRNFAGASLMNIARHYLSAANQTIQLNWTDEEIAAEFIRTQFASGPETMVYGSISGGYAAPGRYPNVLDGMFTKIMAAQHELTATTFRRWCGRLPKALPNLEMHTIFNSGYFPLFSEIADGKPTDEATFDTEVSFVKASRYGRHAKLTPEMIANDDMDFFNVKLNGIIQGHDLTMNVHAVQMLTSQPIIPKDDTVLFDDAAHGNYIADGGVPSIDESKKIRAKLNKQKDISGEHPARLDFKWALIPTDIETEAEQTYINVPGHYPAEINKKNVFSGKVDVIKEPELDRISETEWYAGEDPTKNPSIVYGHMRGYENGRSWRVFDLRTGCVEVHVEGRWAFGVQDYRPVVKNHGQAAGG